jgi:hypothetical protein
MRVFAASRDLTLNGKKAGVRLSAEGFKSRAVHHSTNEWLQDFRSIYFIEELISYSIFCPSTMLFSHFTAGIIVLFIHS